MDERLILITNDDGIHSGGLRRLAEIASAFGRVWIILLWQINVDKVSYVYYN